MKVVYAPRALQDVDQLLAYVAAQSPAVASAMAAVVEAKVAVCGNRPLLGLATDRRWIFRCPIKAYRLTIFYRVRPRKGEVEILRIVRGQRVRRLGRAP
jgi:plasmid stabilization system protein ParE